MHQQHFPATTPTHKPAHAKHLPPAHFKPPLANAATCNSHAYPRSPLLMHQPSICVEVPTHPRQCLNMPFAPPSNITPADALLSNFLSDPQSSLRELRLHILPHARGEMIPPPHGGIPFTISWAPGTPQLQCETRPQRVTPPGQHLPQPGSALRCWCSRTTLHKPILSSPSTIGAFNGAFSSCTCDCDGPIAAFISASRRNMSSLAQDRVEGLGFRV